ncbi:hypothetical protein [Undibacterium pigrum]|uniref:Uncharacterized protein n=1 Tax=Undibacterium pigrum TaxID=401470 RepID=A0A318JDE4_9BURK|nr:hypothetical protein [Undibacterium pigrum]PXX45094.1 hypothetical protein DFR42_102307 [Undibacterium pigrum]
MSRSSSKKLLRLLWAAIMVTVLALVFLAYLRPAFILDLANRFVMC